MTQISLAKCKVDQLVSLCEEFGNQPGELINILHKAQGLIGYLPREVQEVIARQLNIPVSKVYGVVTFYSFFTMTQKVNTRSPCAWEPHATFGVQRRYWMNSNVF